MKIKFIGLKVGAKLSLVSFLFISLPLYAAAKPIVNIQTWQTNNGAHVYFVNAPQIPMVDVQIVFAAGSAYDGKAWGLASFVNSMLNEGTTTENANQIADALDSVGAQVAGDVDGDKATVSLRSLTASKYLTPALNTFTDIVTRPSFPEKAFQRVKNQTLAAIQQSYQQPSTIAAQAFYHALYRDEPYGHPSLGTLNSIKALTRAEVTSFYQKYYVGSNANVIIVGDVSKDQANTIAEQVIGSLPRGEHAPMFDKAKYTEKSGYQFIQFPAKQNTIILGQVGITHQNPQYFPLTIGNHILGGLPLASILFDQVRNQRGLVYDIQSQLVPLQYRGPFAIAFQSRSDKASDALQLVQKILHNYVKNGPTKSEVEDAKQNLLGSFPLKIDTNSDIVANVSNIAFYRLPLDYLDTYRDRVKAVTPDQIKKAFQNEIHPDKMKIVVVGLKNNK